MTRAKRRYLLALVQGRVCRWCKSAVAAWDYRGPECGPCCVKRIDREDVADGGWL